MKCDICGKDAGTLASTCDDCINKQNKNSNQEEQITTDKFTFMSTYKTTRTVAKLISALGWIITFVGGLIFVASIRTILTSGNLFEQGISLMGVMPSIKAVISGLVVTAFGQLTRATVDMADYNREILSIIKTRNH